MNKKLFVILISVLLLFTFSSVTASERITASPGDCFAFYGADMPAAQSYSYAIEVDSKVYYFDDSIANKLAAYSPNFKEVYDQFSSKYVEGMFEADNDKTFEFEYISGQQVGMNSNATVITDVYLS